MKCLQLCNLRKLIEVIGVLTTIGKVQHKLIGRKGKVNISTNIDRLKVMEFHKRIKQMISGQQVLADPVTHKDLLFKKVQKGDLEDHLRRLRLRETYPS